MGAEEERVSYMQNKQQTTVYHLKDLKYRTNISPSSKKVFYFKKSLSFSFG